MSWSGVIVESLFLVDGRFMGILRYMSRYVGISYNYNIKNYKKQELFIARGGFTIVELLIVVVVIAILAAVTLVAYTGIQQQARQSSAQTTLTQIVKSLSLYAVKNNDMYPTSLVSLSSGYVAPAGVTYFYNDHTDEYCVQMVDGATTQSVLSTSSGSFKPVGCDEQNQVARWYLDGNGAEVGSYAGTLYTSPAAAVGQNGEAGGALQFNATSYMEVASGPVIKFNNFTVTAWAKTTAAGDMKIVSTGTNYNPIQLYNNTSRICVSGCSAGGPSLNDGSWHFLATVGDVTGVYGYVDGAASPVVTQSVTSNSSSGVLRIARDVSTNSMGFNGVVDDVRLYDRPLSVAELQSMYAAGAQ